MTEDGIRAKEHLCPKCGGKGKLPLGLGYAFTECDICHGTGKEEITNEQWLCDYINNEFRAMPTEKKAETIANFIGRLVELNGNKLAWMRWLKEIRNAQS